MKCHVLNGMASTSYTPTGTALMSTMEHLEKTDVIVDDSSLRNPDSKSTKSMSFSRLSSTVLTIYLLMTMFLSPVSGVRCFCDKRNCEAALMCTGSACLVGFKSDVRLDQMCATAESDEIAECTENWATWKEVCKCTQDFCNTFNYLRTQMERMRHDGRYPQGRDVPDPDGIHSRPPVYQSNQLVILLVIVPLAIGAAAVILVFLNYHCKMC